MNNALYQKLFSEVIKGGMLCPGRLANLTHSLLQCSKLNGAIVEFGCNAGRTAALMACVCPEKPLWLYDSFKGLPMPTEKDSGQFGAGIMKASVWEVQDHFKTYELYAPTIVEGWFDGITRDQLPDEIAFAHIDCDLFLSTQKSLNLVYPRLAHGGTIVIDDYGWSVTPGVKAAVDKFTDIHNLPRATPLEIGNSNAHQAVIVTIK
jgi:O-methyltransferase